MNTYHSTTHASSDTSAADHNRASHTEVEANGSASGSVLVAVNDGQSGWRALECGAAEASARGSLLRIVHATSWPQWGLDQLGGLTLAWCCRRAADQGTLVLVEAVRRAELAAPHTTITTHLAAGHTGVAIVNARRGDALNVGGSGHKRRPRNRSVVRSVLRLADCSVTIIRTPAITRSGGDQS